MRVDDSDTRYLIPDPAGAIWRVTRGDDARARDEIVARRLEDPALFD